MEKTGMILNFRNDKYNIPIGFPLVDLLTIFVAWSLWYY